MRFRRIEASCRCDRIARHSSACVVCLRWSGTCDSPRVRRRDCDFASGCRPHPREPQRRRRVFAERCAILGGKASEFDEAVARRDLRHRHPGCCAMQFSTDRAQARVVEKATRRAAVHHTKREAYHPGTDRSFPVDIGKVQRLARKRSCKLLHLLNDMSVTFARLSHRAPKRNFSVRTCRRRGLHSAGTKSAV
jgi:hypothetical protein